MPDIFVADTKNEVPAPNLQKPEEVVAEKPIASTMPDEPKENGSGAIHLFTSFRENPEDISFENQDQDENVLLFLRKDMITNLPWILTGFFLIIIPLIIMPILNFLHISILNLPQNYSLVLIIFYYLIVATFLFISFITWYFNIDLVTEKRIIDVDLEGIVYKNVAATKLNLVQDVSYAQVGVVRTVFDYGDVLVQTAGTLDNFVFQAVPRPEDAVHVIENLIGKKNEQL
jgi:hypothetical protein